MNVTSLFTLITSTASAAVVAGSSYINLYVTVAFAPAVAADAATGSPVVTTLYPYFSYSLASSIPATVAPASSAAVYATPTSAYAVFPPFASKIGRILSASLFTAVIHAELAS